MNKQESFTKILSENSARIHRICRYYNSNSEDQKDMYQEILINIWKSLDNFRGDSAINTWIYRVAVNTALTFTGKTYTRMKLFITTETQNLESIFEDETIETKQIFEIQYDQLQIELNLLSVIDKTLLSLTFEGLTMKEIADIIGITEPNVKVKIHRIKEQLKFKLNGGNHELK